MTHLRQVTLAVLVAALGACGPGQPASNPHELPSPQAQRQAPEAASPAEAPGTAAPATTTASAVPAAVESLLATALRRDPRSTGKDFPACPPLSAEVKRGVAKEVAHSAAVREALAELDPPRYSEATADPLATLAREHAVFSLAALVCHDNDDVKITSARALAELADPAPLPFLLAVAHSFAVFESGSENATLHGMIQHALAEALNAMTGEHVALAQGQDPGGLERGIPTWQTHRTR